MIQHVSKARADGYSGDQLVSAFMWLGSYDDWKARQSASSPVLDFSHKAQGVVNGVVDSVVVPVDFFRSNWQLLVVGGFALYLILKRV